jgi:hypothetical protein
MSSNVSYFLPVWLLVVLIPLFSLFCGILWCSTKYTDTGGRRTKKELIFYMSHTLFLTVLVAGSYSLYQQTTLVVAISLIGMEIFLGTLGYVFGVIISFKITPFPVYSDGWGDRMTKFSKKL